MNHQRKQAAKAEEDVRAQQIDFGQTDQYGRRKFAIKSSFTSEGIVQPPKPLEKPPSFGYPGQKLNEKQDVPPPEKRKLLQLVDRDFNPDSQLGKVVTITTANVADLEAQSVFYCKTCKVQLKDSNAWYDHINGKKHNQMLGMSMVVERVTVDKVRAKLAGLKRKTAEAPVDSIEAIQKRIEDQEKEEEDKARLKRRKVREDETAHDRLLEEEIGFNEEDITAFGLPMDFGSTKKKN